MQVLNQYQDVWSLKSPTPNHQHLICMVRYNWAENMYRTQGKFTQMKFLDNYILLDYWIRCLNLDIAASISFLYTHHKGLHHQFKSIGCLHNHVVCNNPHTCTNNTNDSCRTRVTSADIPSTEVHSKEGEYCKLCPPLRTLACAPSVVATFAKRSRATCM